jgi:hypothetical protein
LLNIEDKPQFHFNMTSFALYQGVILRLKKTFFVLAEEPTSRKASAGHKSREILLQEGRLPVVKRLLENAC